MAIKLIYQTSVCDRSDDPSMPFKLDLVLRAPEFMAVTWAFLHGGTEQIIVRANTYEELTAWMDLNNLKTHVRLSRYSITDCSGVVVESYDRCTKKETA